MGFFRDRSNEEVGILRDITKIEMNIKTKNLYPYQILQFIQNLMRRLDLIDLLYGDVKINDKTELQIFWESWDLIDNMEHQLNGE